jgi:hypothetical protein
MRFQKNIEGSIIESERFDYRTGDPILRFDYRTRERFSASMIEAEKSYPRSPQTRMDIESSAFSPEVARRSPSASTIERLLHIAIPRGEITCLRSGFPAFHVSNPQAAHVGRK